MKINSSRIIFKNNIFETVNSDRNIIKKQTVKGDRLSEDKLGVAEDFIEDLQAEEEIDATEELLLIPDLTEAFKKGKSQIEEGKVRYWKEIRKDI